MFYQFWVIASADTTNSDESPGDAATAYREAGTYRDWAERYCLSLNIMTRYSLQYHLEADSNYMSFFYMLSFQINSVLLCLNYLMSLPCQRSTPLTHKVHIAVSIYLRQ